MTDYNSFLNSILTEIANSLGVPSEFIFQPIDTRGNEVDEKHP